MLSSYQDQTRNETKQKSDGSGIKRNWLVTATLLGFGSLLVLSAFLAISVTVSTAASAPPSSGFNQAGNVLITDQFNNRVIEINPVTKHIVWSFGSGNPNLCNPGPGAIIGSNDAERVGNGITLMAGTGIPAGVPGTTACVDNRVIAVNRAGQIVWQYGQAGKTGTGYDLLNVPVFAIQLPNHDILITDQGNNRIIEVNLQKQIVWSYGPKSGPGALNSPNSAELLSNGHILIADENNNRVIEITRSGQIVWEYSQGLLTAAFASRLPNGDTLITDSGHNRIIQVTPSKQVVFQYFTNTSANSNANPSPTNAVRLATGNTMIADQFNSRVIEINPQKHIVFQYGMTNVTGEGFNQLFDPYTG
ncbi:MAG TPA: PQQ-binding-like beta-propeller repeat protein, partial [Nitrososphaerales archaeon]|nr:PQQ-binding-like beta-propeller repeat protein [Nitrososphaerales archaeon]